MCLYVDSRGRSEHARSDKTEERQERGRSRGPQKILISDASKTLSLKVGDTFLVSFVRDEILFKKKIKKHALTLKKKKK